KFLDTSLIIHALHNIARHFGVEKTHRQFHELDQEIGQNRYVDPGTDMQQYPRTYKFHRYTPEYERNLSYQNNVNEIDIAGIDADVDYSLGKKWGHKL